MITPPASNTSAHSTLPSVSERLNSIFTLQIGMGWLPDQPGNGLDQVFYALARHLPDAGVHVDGVVMGQGPGERGSSHRIEHAAPTSAPLPRRLRGVRTATRTLVNARPPDLVLPPTLPSMPPRSWTR